jgi:hypothetical protein
VGERCSSAPSATHQTIGGVASGSMRVWSTPETEVAAADRAVPRPTNTTIEAAHAAMTRARRAGARSWSKIPMTAVRTTAMTMTTGVVLMA